VPVGVFGEVGVKPKSRSPAIKYQKNTLFKGLQLKVGEVSKTSAQFERKCGTNQKNTRWIEGRGPRSNKLPQTMGDENKGPKVNRGKLVLT